MPSKKFIARLFQLEINKINVHNRWLDPEQKTVVGFTGNADRCDFVGTKFQYQTDGIRNGIQFDISILVGLFPPVRIFWVPAAEYMRAKYRIFLFDLYFYLIAPGDFRTDQGERR